MIDMCSGWSAHGQAHVHSGHGCMGSSYKSECLASHSECYRVQLDSCQSYGQSSRVVFTVGVVVSSELVSYLAISYFGQFLLVVRRVIYSCQYQLINDIRVHCNFSLIDIIKCELYLYFLPELLFSSCTSYLIYKPLYP